MLKAVLAIFFPLLCAAQIRAADSVRAVRVDKPPRIDGRLDDLAWQTAAVIDKFYQREPQPGAAVSEKTEVLICYDRAHIFLGFRCSEQDPSGITAKELARDADLGQDDRVQVILDTFLDGRNAYWFQIGPRGSIGDALVGDNGGILNKNWDGLWDGKARIHKGGWDAEMAIPFKTLSFKPDSGRWGLKLIRHIKRKLESSYWPVANLDTWRFQVSDAGILDGLDDISQGIGIDVGAYALGGWTQNVPTGIDGRADAGLDVYYRLTPGLRSVFSYNTDFAQTEVDTQQINLTRFPLFYPEKRDFFLDGANYFNFGPAGTRLIPFFSRRIGLDANRNPIPMTWGGKLTGQVGQWNIGMLNAMDERSDRNQNFFVARASRNLGSQSAIGMIVTDGNADSLSPNTVLGADLKLASSKFLRNKNISFTAFGLESRTETTAGKSGAFGGEFLYPNDLLNLKLGYHQIGDAFLAGVGFVPRTGIRDMYFQADIGPRPQRWGILQFLLGVNFDRVTDLDNNLLTRMAGVTPLGVRFNSGDEAHFRISRQYEFLDSPFHLPRSTIRAGSYEFTRNTVQFQSAQRRNFWASGSVGWGSFYDGTREDLTAGIGWKVRVPLYLGMNYEQNRVELPGGNFTAQLTRVNANILISTNITLYSFFQYDHLSDTLGWQSRFRWILSPGNEVLFVWNSRWLDPLSVRELTESAALVKLRYVYRF